VIAWSLGVPALLLGLGMATIPWGKAPVFSWSDLPRPPWSLRLPHSTRKLGLFASSLFRVHPLPPNTEGQNWKGGLGRLQGLLGFGFIVLGMLGAKTGSENMLPWATPRKPSSSGEKSPEPLPDRLSLRPRRDSPDTGPCVRRSHLPLGTSSRCTPWGRLRSRSTQSRLLSEAFLRKRSGEIGIGNKGSAEGDRVRPSLRERPIPAPEGEPACGDDVAFPEWPELLARRRPPWHHGRYPGPSPA
jgi:hypothetical protein